MEKKCGEWYPNTAKTSFFKFHYRQRSSGWRCYFVVLYISSTSNWCDRAIHVSCQRLMRDFASTVFAAECSEVKSGVAPQDGTKSGAIHDSMIALCLASWTGCHRLFLWLEKEANLYPNVTNQTLSRWTLRSAQAISGGEVLVLPLSFLVFLRTTRQKAVRERTFRALGRDRIGEVKWSGWCWLGGCLGGKGDCQAVANATQIHSSVKGTEIRLWCRVSSKPGAVHRVSLVRYTHWIFTWWRRHRRACWPNEWHESNWDVETYTCVFLAPWISKLFAAFGDTPSLDILRPWTFRSLIFSHGGVCAFYGPTKMSLGIWNMHKNAIRCWLENLSLKQQQKLQTIKYPSLVCHAFCGGRNCAIFFEVALFWYKCWIRRRRFDMISLDCWFNKQQHSNGSG